MCSFRRYTNVFDAVLLLVSFELNVHIITGIST